MKKHKHSDSVGVDICDSCLESQGWEWMGPDPVSERNTQISIDIFNYFSKDITRAIILSIKTYRAMDYEET